jgi:hypothetical protein
LCADAFGWDAAMCEKLSLNALRASLLPRERKTEMEREFRVAFAQLREAFGL